MKQIDVEVLVIGGGATGTGVVRDLAMRGFRAALVERRDLTHGTTGRYHGLLHSGGRYVVKDPLAARECIEENRILRKIIPHCIEDTGGFFVATPWDDPDYADRFVEGCRKAGIPVEEIPVAQMLRTEPLLNPAITRCFRVPDASADSFAAAEANVESARQYSAQIFTYHEVRRLLHDNQKIIGAVCFDLVNDEEVQFNANVVVNAAGAWAGKVAAMAGMLVQIKPGKGTMLAINHRIVNTVINRCKMPADGDILVPAHTVSVIGTTDEQVADPDHYAIEAWEVQLMMEEGEKLIPGFKELRVLRAWAGVRPLYQETAANSSRDITRAYVLLDHEFRDGISGFVTITSGKWTTYRKMAEVTVDKVCEKLHVSRPCRTHLEPIPANNGHAKGYQSLGSRLATVEKDHSFGSLICECELVSPSEIAHAITAGGAKTIDDIRRDTRLGMGPCQGGFCTLRAAGLLHHLRSSPIEDINLALRDFLQERWKGLLPILWGQQLRQERLDELIYLDVLNTDHLPGGTASRLASEDYLPATYTKSTESKLPVQQPIHNSVKDTSPKLDLVVIGAGLAGLASAWYASKQGMKVRLVSKGWGELYWGSGCIDVLGYYTDRPNNPVLEPGKAITEMIHHNSRHPYALAGIASLSEALTEFQEMCFEAGYPLISAGEYALDQNWLIPTVLGSLRPTCLAPVTMIAGDCRPQTAKKSILLVGFQGYLDFFPEMAAANLVRQGLDAHAVTLEIPQLKELNFVTSRVLANLFEVAAFRTKVVEQLRGFLKDLNYPAPLAVGFPAVLGLEHTSEVWNDLQNQLGHPIFELPGLPPSIPGIRLHRILNGAIQKQGGQVFDGMQVVEFQAESSLIQAVYSEAAARLQPHMAANYILATGGFLGGGLVARDSASIDEPIFHIPIAAPGDREEWFQRQFLVTGGHPIFSVGVPVNQHLQPQTMGSTIYRNLYAVGGALAGVDSIRERSIEGIALATAFAAVSNLENRGSNEFQHA
jgi:glycerol-3-phosphate dehydrogenase